MDARGVAGVHLCRADDQGSQIVTAEKRARSEGTQIPRWLLLVEGSSAQAVSTARAGIVQALQTHEHVRDCQQAVYLLEQQRCKFPWGDR